jgi:hypothetical protein
LPEKGTGGEAQDKVYKLRERRGMRKDFFMTVRIKEGGEVN